MWCKSDLFQPRMLHFPNKMTRQLYLLARGNLSDDELLWLVLLMLLSDLSGLFEPRLQYVSDCAMRVVYTCLEPSIIMTYDTQQCTHTVWSLRRVSTEVQTNRCILLCPCLFYRVKPNVCFCVFYRNRPQCWSVPSSLGRFTHQSQPTASLVPTWETWAGWTYPLRPCTATPCTTKAESPPPPACTLGFTRPAFLTWLLSGASMREIIWYNL